MSQKLPGSICPWFSVPKVVLRDGLWAILRLSEAKLYVALLYESERISRLEFRLTDERLRRLTGTAGRTLRNARIKLQEYRLIRYRLEPQGFVYSICDPNTGERFPESSTNLRAKPQNSGAEQNKGSRTGTSCSPGGMPLDFSGSKW
jgi:hypothetical protein